MSTAVLVADDSAMARKMLIRALPPEWDVSVSQAVNGTEALDACRAGKADVMFLDLQMPDMNGFEVLERLRTEQLDSFVIVVSADIQPLARERVLGLGAAAFVKKPVSSVELDGLLRQFGVHA